jgi:hypothetical protein
MYDSEGMGLVASSGGISSSSLSLTSSTKKATP